MNYKCDINVFDLIDNYRIIKPIGDGGFAYVFFVRDESTNRAYAMKISKDPMHNQVIDLERDVMEEITGNSCFPVLVKSGYYRKNMYIIMELLGMNLASIRKLLDGKKFSLYTSLVVASQTINILEIFHNKGFVHRDVKPSNFLVKQKNVSELCLIDFGLSKRYIDPNTGKPHPKSDKVRFVGTSRYASINALKDNDVSVCDDLISWFYMIVEQYVGQLPWSSITDKELILAMKIRTPVEELCSDLPQEMINIYKYLETLQYDDVVDYTFIHSQILEAIKNLNESNSKLLDWEQNPAITASIIGAPLKRLLSDTLEGKSPEEVDVENSPSKPPPKPPVRGIERELLNADDVNDTINDINNQTPILMTDQAETGCCCCSCYAWRILFHRKR
ncbi:CK1 family protein kinase [Trichomonas vaginalis G3]|uniref:non-specific serine/threonine protein kinase n=1 Tax=Trichomonas vaginalis (strain ATCC PRA-98 / G3) TaxID=412133 RepID=A2DUS7_TRIV3|nr:protein kinase protein [Trichomonas vaginalis G3]EAY15812.1 CK1 family protein kinase [Trichomonas vaginalis G3]KAI5525017.1 protein kinase protein [Trichomonas vaginalis G3]|eukprot:XP_001328035.1 CK1 family protein kinase [Trichomonas vaginalis G3]